MAVTAAALVERLASIENPDRVYLRKDFTVIDRSKIQGVFALIAFYISLIFTTQYKLSVVTQNLHNVIAQSSRDLDKCDFETLENASKTLTALASKVQRSLSDDASLCGGQLTDTASILEKALDEMTKPVNSDDENGEAALTPDIRRELKAKTVMQSFFVAAGIDEDATLFTPQEVCSRAQKALMYSTGYVEEEAIFVVARNIEQYRSYFDPRFVLFIKSVSESLAKGANITSLKEGNATSGVYFGKSIVIKPSQEAPGMPFNQVVYDTDKNGKAKTFAGSAGGKVFSGRDISSGDEDRNEQLAFLTDYENGGGANVPWSMRIRMKYRHPMVRESGSDHKEVLIMQKIEGREGGDVMLRSVDWGIAEFGKVNSINQTDLENIADLDTDILNVDRHLTGNIFMRQDGRKSYRLLAIDHGLSRKGKESLSEVRLDWMYFPQLRRPINEELKKRILNRDIEGRVELLKKFNCSDDVIRYESLAIKFKQMGVEKGLNFYDLATLLTLGGAKNSYFALAIEYADKHGLSPEEIFKDLIDQTVEMKKMVLKAVKKGSSAMDKLSIQLAQSRWCFRIEDRDFFAGGYRFDHD